MTLNPDGHPVPQTHRTDLFTIQRQQLTDSDLDFEAVMNSREKLRIWSDSDWPEDEFTPAENLADLQMHIDEHQRDEAYGFSVFTPDESRLLGSLYLDEVAPFLEDYQSDQAAADGLKQCDVRAEYWLRVDVSPELEAAFLKAVLVWLDGTWWFKRVTFGSRRGMVDQRQQYIEAGMTEIAQLTAKSGPRQFYFHTVSTN